MANRTKCENLSHYSASSKGQQGKSAHLVHSFSTPLPSAFAFFFERLFVCVSATIVPLLHVRVLAIPTTNYDFNCYPKQRWMLFISSKWDVWVELLLIMMRARHGKYQRNDALSDFLIHIQKKWHCERLRCIILVRSSHS
ncbi:hypothetical protein K457DRAFT_134920 [Linnemannia elongata AG-77]|uniref:Uncharacterized protein n=1 Tax=Linnemannia elongata AG-77 TaxID=1314771 RepID=A0A197K572_9FUNG|nr:hypothetical protein K457DRAFT_134920 [Linnemannia elongata AG-77]